MILTNLHNVPNQVFLKIQSDLLTDPYKGITIAERFRVTELQNAPLPLTLWKENIKTDKLVIDATDYLQVLFGTAVHAILEGEDTDDVKYEFRVVSEIEIEDFGKATVAGTVDEYWPKLNQIIDNKTGLISSVNFPIDDDYIKQVNVYAYLLGLWDKGEPKLFIRYFLKDWSKAASMRQPDYPKSMIHVRECPVMKKDEVEDYIKSRLCDHIANPSRLCTPDERNFSNDKPYQVMGANKDRAVRNFATAHEAQEYIVNSGKPYTVHFKGDDLRCRIYCKSRSVCQYAKQQGYVL